MLVGRLVAATFAAGSSNLCAWECAHLCAWECACGMGVCAWVFVFVVCYCVCVLVCVRERERECERGSARERERESMTVLRSKVSRCAKGKRAHFGAAMEEPASIESGTAGERDG